MTINPSWTGASSPDLPRIVRPIRRALAAPEDRGPGVLLRRPLRRGLLVIICFTTVLGGWGATAPIAGGAIAPARVNPDGGVRTVQHLEGGIIRTLHVRDGDTVEEGAPLVTLESVGASAEVHLLERRRQALVAEEARLDAERLGAAEIAFPADLQEPDPAIAALVQAETRVFETRRQMAESRKDILSRRIDQLHDRISGYRAQAESAERQIALAGEELATKDSLMAKGLTSKTDVLQLGRMIASLEGARGEHLAEIASAEQQIDETRVELLAVDVETTAESARRTAEIRLELEEIDRSLDARGDILRRAVILAPKAGVVANLQVNTVGGVVAPGAPILDIVPAAETLRVDARVKPTDIDLVAIGDTAIVTLTAFSGREAPRLEGRVAAISADALQDETTSRDYYAVRVEILHDELARIPSALVPGMGADVMIVTQERTLIAYLLEPFGQVLRRGFRES